jgi:hypothetical protein
MLSHTVRVCMYVCPCSIMQDVSVLVQDVTATGNSAPSGGAVSIMQFRSQGGMNVTLSRVNISDNAALVQGGGLDVLAQGGTVTIDSSTITGNTVSLAGRYSRNGLGGGGVFVATGLPYSVDCGGLGPGNGSATAFPVYTPQSSLSSLVISGSVVSGNAALCDACYGGGVAVTGSGAVSIVASTVSEVGGSAWGGGPALQSWCGGGEGA